ncbi:hypothetical protein [Treponema endosymbiont of Eucomonympha sp.]|uniref:hypothetical protein n=1 Tax=Treponema endosymbiont of Eucomonympha sp. TaxID=1580831 RepID=UPI000780CEBF|nr:hypothetical protein [Treponema endosymbiont of Eucomonympha sp.]
MFVSLPSSPRYLERKAAAARFNDGDYIFYFKNGATASGDCDGYSSEYGGKTTIYEWWKSDIKNWIKRLKAAGANIETNSNKYQHGYYWVSFPTNLIYGTGLHEMRSVWGNEPTGAAYLRRNGTETKIKNTVDFRFAQTSKDFNWESGEIKNHNRRSLSVAHSNKDIPELGVVFTWGQEKVMNSVSARGYSIEEVSKGEAYIIDASTIEWFAYDDEG